MNTYDLGGRHAVITGGAAGIGLAIARRMLASGALVSLWDRDPVALERAKAELGPEVSTVLVDLTKHEQVVEATAKSLKQSASGAVDILINSAGITGPNGPVETYPLE
jgi:3-oxoacyl-[acyl-carrier protein] reductase